LLVEVAVTEVTEHTAIVIVQEAEVGVVVDNLSSTPEESIVPNIKKNDHPYCDNHLGEQ